MNKLKLLFSAPQFWIYFWVSALVVFALESFMLGLWEIPVIGYRVNFMEVVTQFDLAFVVGFALLFGFGTALFLLMREFSKASCAIGASSGIFAFLTLLCPVCPVFFIAYFGLSASLTIISPYFLWIRLVSVLLLLAGVIILWRKSRPEDVPSMNWHVALQKFAVFAIAVLFVGNQALAMEIGKELIGPQAGEPIELTGNFAGDVAALVTPVASPFYGPELGLDFSSVSAINASIKKLSVMAPKQGSSPIPLNDEEMKRYIAIGTEPTVACEFCCGAKTLVTDTGEPTCGCAHSIAMRGTIAYLIKNKPDMTNAEIAYEIIRQKGLYFPKQMQERMATQLSGNTADFTADIKYLTQNLTPSELANLQKKSKAEGFVPKVDSGMVGGC